MDGGREIGFYSGRGSEGVVATCMDYRIYASAYYKWKRRYDAIGIEGLSNRMSMDLEFEGPMRENQRLKQLLSDKELELSIKESLFKKHTREKERMIVAREYILLQS